MKKRTKILLPTTALALGIGAFALTGELSEGTKAYQNYATQNEYKTGDIYTGKKANAKQNAKRHIEIEGKVTGISKDSITVDVPFQGSKTFKIDKNTKLKKSSLKKISKGSLVEIDANGDYAYKIEAEKSIETEGIIIKITEQEVTAEQNGKQETFKKAGNFRIDAEDYSGALEGLQAEIKLNAKSEVKELEIDEDGADD
ncbi:DUF5666 domain-containing protein [Aciduricibacillus chroicocephali]|uniref:DUF5666 domain-containing protein n=1 Tax=Aciduricibacillus chroicocephali TaxID=3054939 RepID=A0ABY9KVW0_9BACI|nr:DUF5666 domain-containing protein [Bacillaceae bacterium 44XB]